MFFQIIAMAFGVTILHYGTVVSLTPVAAPGWTFRLVTGTFTQDQFSVAVNLVRTLELIVLEMQYNNNRSNPNAPFLHLTGNIHNMGNDTAKTSPQTCIRFKTKTQHPSKQQ
jgi:hypothetical protein